MVDFSAQTAKIFIQKSSFGNGQFYKAKQASEKHNENE